MSPETLPPPRARADLVGHEAAERDLLAAVLGHRLPHAWLFAGPPGIGKATLAFRFARFLLSGEAEAGGGLFGAGPESLAIPPDHPTFRRVASGGHADLLTVERPVVESKDKGERRARDLPIEAVRRIAPFLRMTPAEGGWRVVILDEAERMNRHGANAVLKVLEEPPARALIILVANNPGALLPTIRSRCRLLRLSPLPEARVAAVLAEAAPDMPEADRRALARLAEGSIGRALGLLREDGLALYRALLDLLAGLPDPDPLVVHALGDRLSGPGGEQAWQTMTELLQGWLERLVRGAARGAWPADIVGGEAALMDRLGGRRGLDRLLALWDKTGHLFARTDGANLDRKQAVLAAFATLSAAFRG